MVLPGEGPTKTSDEVLSALEGHLIQRGIGVVSSGMTGRVVSDLGLVEGAAQLPPLERVIVLAKKANIDCVFQLQRLDIGIRDASRYFYLNAPGLGMKETFSVASLDPSRGWTLSGPAWEIGGKVIDVENGDVLAIVDLYQSTVWAIPTQVFHVQTADGVTLPTTGGERGWRIDDVDPLRRSMMSLLATIIAGPPTAVDPGTPAK